MDRIEIRKNRSLRGEITVPGDKSISHRAVMFGSLASGKTEITGFLPGADCLSTISCFRRMGIEIDRQGSTVTVHGRGLHGLSCPSGTLDTGNSGTTMRLISGILSGQKFASRLSGDESICRRPMKRIITPLTMMHADIRSEKENGCAPLVIRPGTLRAVHYTSPVASAQVKSCVLLAGMYAEGITKVTEPVLSRNHTEIMLRCLGASVTSEGTTVSIEPEPRLTGQKISVPGDISSAAYFIAAGLITPDSEILIRNVGINPTRDGILEVLQKMGADIRLLNVRQDGEPTADLLVKTSSLHGTVIGGDVIPRLIDEIPVIAVLACFAEGTTVIRDAAELRVKESDRITVMTENLRRMGADIEPAPDGMTIRGGAPLHGAVVDPHADHRAAMALAAAGTVCDGNLLIEGGNCTDISYPGFYRDLYSLSCGSV